MLPIDGATARWCAGPKNIRLPAQRAISSNSSVYRGFCRCRLSFDLRAQSFDYGALSEMKMFRQLTTGHEFLGLHGLKTPDSLTLGQEFPLWNVTGKSI
jgi:hypothetical protein